MVGSDDLFIAPDAETAKASILSIADAAETPASDFIPGEPTERWIEIMAQAMFAWGAVPTQAVAGMFLDRATDPGDAGDLSTDQTPRPGFLSALGLGWYFTERRGQTYATVTLTVTNAGTSPARFAPLQLTAARSTTGPDGGVPTYRNTADPSIYTNLDGTLTLAPSASIDLPFQADIIGSYSSASAAQISDMVTQSFGTLTCTNAGAAIGDERETPEAYRARCRLAANSNAPGGPVNAYLRAMNTARDGSPLQRFDGTGAVGITRAYVSADSATGDVTLYFADDDGAADTVDVSSANANICGIALGIITDPSGVLPDCVTLLPTASDANTLAPGGAPAVNTTINWVATGKIKARAGISNAALKAAAEAAGNASIAPWLATKPVGGDDQVSGAGVIYTTDGRQTIAGSYAGLYDVIVTTPGAATTAITLGHVGVAGTVALTVTVVA